MDRISLGSKSGSDLDNNKNDSFNDTVLRRFKFVKSLKNYVVSKIRSAKYDLCNNAQQEISIISYDQRNFTDADKELDLQTSKSVKIDTEAFENMRKALNESLRNKHQENNAYLELLEIAEKTFARQLNIFEGILKLINANNNECNAVENGQKRLVSGYINDESIDAFAGSVVRNLITELTKGIFGVGQRSVEAQVELLVEACPEENLENNDETKKVDAASECPEPIVSESVISTTRNVAT